LRFGFELIFAPCEIPPSLKEELVQEVIEITTVFSAQLYSRSHKTKRLLNELNANGDKVTEPDIITKSEDVSEAVRDLCETVGLLTATPLVGRQVGFPTRVPYTEGTRRLATLASIQRHAETTPTNHDTKKCGIVRYDDRGSRERRVAGSGLNPMSVLLARSNVRVHIGPPLLMVAPLRRTTISLV
jgi:hypothetical protein